MATAGAVVALNLLRRHFDPRSHFAFDVYFPRPGALKALDFAQEPGILGNAGVGGLTQQQLLVDQALEHLAPGCGRRLPLFHPVGYPRVERRELPLGNRLASDFGQYQFRRLLRTTGAEPQSDYRDFQIPHHPYSKPAKTVIKVVVSFWLLSSFVNTPGRTLSSITLSVSVRPKRRPTCVVRR